MNKLTTLALAGLVAVAASAVASDSRMAGFGASSAFIADVQDIWTLPAVVASNKNATYFEMGDYTNFAFDGYDGNQDVNDPNDNVQYTGQAWGGVHAEVGPGVLAIWVNRPTSLELDQMLNNVSGTISDNFYAGWFGTGNYNAQGRVDLFYGFGLGDKVDLGVHLSRINNDRKAEVKNVYNYGVGYDLKAIDSVTGLGFGIGADIKEVAIFKLLQVGLDIDTLGETSTEEVTNSGEGEQKYTLGANTIKVRVGGDVSGDEGKFGRLEFGFGLGSASEKNDAYGTASGDPAVGNKEGKASAMAWNLGYALGKSGDKGMGLAGLMLEGISFSQESDAPDTKSEQSSLTLALSTAGEAKVKEWLTARAGLSANLLQMDSTKYPSYYDWGTGNNADNNTRGNSQNGTATISTGLSMVFGDLTIDGVLNQDLLFTGSYLISGLQETLFSKVSATWGW